MDYTICSREFECDYAWDNSHASHLFAECAQAKFAPAFEGSITTSRFVALLRCADSLSNVVLCVSVSTERIDFRHRPIRTMAFLRAENPDEAKLLAAFFAECLRKSYAETPAHPEPDALYHPESGIAKAVESLYQKKAPDEFLAFCRTLPPVGGNGSAPTKRVAFPRNDMEKRQSLADALSTTVIKGNSPFLFVLTDRLPTDVLDSLGPMFDHATIRIFSKAVDHHREDIPEPVQQKYRWAAAIGAAVILALLVAAMANLPRGCRKQVTTGKTGVSGPGESISVTTNAQPQVVTETNAPSNSQTESVGTAASATTNAAAQKAAVTNSLKSASARAEKGKTGK